jgi:hypothetical protein
VPLTRVAEAYIEVFLSIADLLEPGIAVAGVAPRRIADDSDTESARCADCPPDAAAKWILQVLAISLARVQPDRRRHVQCLDHLRSRLDSRCMSRSGLD